MAVERKRGCGYRHVHGIYLVGGLFTIPCDRLPFPIRPCPVCGSGPHFTRGLAEIDPLAMFGTHDVPVKVFAGEPGLEAEIKKVNCYDKFRPCIMCDPSHDLAYILGVGEQFYPTPKHFMEEARVQGVSKRIAQVPKHLVPGKTVIYLAHRKACMVDAPLPVAQAEVILEQKSKPAQPRLIETPEQVYKLGIFSAFVPQRVEQLFWKSELDKKLRERCKKRGVVPVAIPDGDLDHMPTKRGKATDDD